MQMMPLVLVAVLGREEGKEINSVTAHDTEYRSCNSV